MKSPGYSEKLSHATDQASRVEKSLGKPDVKFNSYIKQRKAQVKEISKGKSR